MSFTKCYTVGWGIYDTAVYSLRYGVYCFFIRRIRLNIACKVTIFLCSGYLYEIIILVIRFDKMRKIKIILCLKTSEIVH